MNRQKKARVAMVTICKGRLAHLRQSLPLMLAQSPDEMVVVDYGCPEGTGDWVSKNFPSVTVVRVEDDPTFNASRARNKGWEGCTSPWVICLDADILPRPGWLDWIRPRLIDEKIYLRSSLNAGERCFDSYGMACVSRKAFEHIGGYDEVFSGWGGEDTDFFERLAYAGYVEKSYPNSYLGRIDHTDSERTTFYDIKDPFVSQIANRLYSVIKQNIERRRQTRLGLQERREIMNKSINESLRMFEDPSYVPQMAINVADYTYRRHNSTSEKIRAARFNYKFVVTVEALDAEQQEHPDKTKPKISCLMVTKGRSEFIAQSLKCFVKQTYPNKELVIVADQLDVSELGTLIKKYSAHNIRLVHVSDKIMTLGDLRNIAVESAHGEYVCQWDDDDLYHPERLNFQFRALSQHNAHACLLSKWMVWWPAMKRLAISGERNWEGSLLCRKALMPRYPSLKKGEDTPVVEQLINHANVIRLDMPALYLYIFHGDNTFSIDHFEEIYNHAARKFEGESYIRAYDSLSKVLPMKEYPSQ